MKHLILCMILCGFAYAQNNYTYITPFPTGLDTVAGVSSPDTVKWRLSLDGVDGPWNTITTYVDTTTKQNETVMVFDLSGETNWTWGESLTILIQGITNSVTSRSFKVSTKTGAVTLFLAPDTVGTNTFYTGSRIGGN